MATTGKEPTQVDEVVELYKNIQAAISNETQKALEKDYPEKFQEFKANKTYQMLTSSKKLLKELPADKPVDFSPTEVESRQELVKLQAGDSENLAIWKKLIDLSKVEFDAVYSRLDIEFDNTLGESSTTRGFSPLLMNCAKRCCSRK